METIGFIVLIIVALAIWNAAYKSGKREGSRKGYGVGFNRGRRSKPSTGCLVLFLVLGSGTMLGCGVAASTLIKRGNHTPIADTALTRR